MAKGEDQLILKIKYEVIPLINEYINDGILNVSASEKSKVFDAWKNLTTIPVKEEECDTEEFLEEVFEE